MSPEDVQRCLDLLERARGLAPDDPDYLRIEQAAAHLRKTAKRRRSRERSRAAAVRDKALLRSPEPGGRLTRQRCCYVCKRPYVEPHLDYPQMCRACGERSRAERTAPLSLEGRRALVTGGRVKVGHAVVRALLDAGAEVHLTTRYPYDAARRLADLDVDPERVVVHGLDFRKVDRVLAWLEELRAGPPFDIVVNNAAQTVWRAPEVRARWQRVEEGADARGFRVRAERAPATPGALVPWAPEALDVRRANSWVQKLAEIDPWEMMEVQVVNAIVPFLVCGRMFDSLRRSPHADRYIVNVTAAEGQFSRADKPVRHPHTNMAKAALNMLTRTSAADYAEHGIFMTAVDPGWISHEGPPEQVAAFERHGVGLPLEPADAAARVLQPIREGRAGRPVHGVLLKDFAVVPW